MAVNSGKLPEGYGYAPAQAAAYAKKGRRAKAAKKVRRKRARGKVKPVVKPTEVAPGEEVVK